MTCSSNANEEYRCSIATENSAAKLKIAGFWYRANVLDMSRTGYRIRLPNAVAKKLRTRRLPVLNFSGEQWEVEVKSRYSDDGKFTELGLARRKELTKYKQPSSWSFAAPKCLSVDSDPAFLGFLVLAFVSVVLSLPGIGDSLGTAPRVRDVVKSVLGSP